jgi:tellurite methyltransferase
MQSRTREQYDKLYSSDNNVFGHGRSEPLLEKMTEFLKPGAKVIEFGAGQGRNSIFLAEKGYTVRATDISPVGIELINKFAQENSLHNLNAEVGDACDEINENYDAMISTFMLHHLTRENALRFIARIQARTNIGGLNFLATFTDDGDFFRKNPTTDKFHPVVNELKGLYADWVIVEYNESTSRAQATKPDGSPMFNVVARILARKVN